MATRKNIGTIVTFHMLMIFAFVSVHTTAFTGEEITQTTITISAEYGNDSASCLTGSMPCKSLEYTSKRVNNTKIIFSPGVHPILSSPTGNAVIFDNPFNVTLMGSGDPWSSEPANTTVLKCYSYDGPSAHDNNLKFINCYNVTIVNVIFEGCGTMSSQGLFVMNAKVFQISNCIFRNNHGPAIKFENPANLSITNTLIFNNSGQIYDDTPITDNYGFNLNQSNGGIGIVYTKIMHPILIIRNCTFDSNHALVNPQNSNDTRPGDYQPFGTGGGLFIHFANASYGRLEIKDCRFINNTALIRGGALYVAFWGHSEGNHINIQKSSFSKNYCADAGGAISLNSFSSSHENLITIAESNFTENKAEHSCGAMVYRFSNELISLKAPDRSYSNKIMIKGCIFRENRAASVSALGLFMFGRVDRRTLPVLIEDTIFESNMASYINCNTATRKILRLVKRNITSAVFAEMSIELKGNTSFLNNIGGGITIVEKRIDIHDNIEFVNNCSPYDGGGLSLEDESFIQLFSASHVVFKNNSAKTGGAISVFTPIIYKDINVPFYVIKVCFMQYQILISDRIDPEKWEVNMTFEDNKAFSGGGALYVNDISPCGYASTEQKQTDTDPAPSFNHSVLALPQFTYRENTVMEPVNKMNNPTFSSISSKLSVTIHIPSNGVAPCEIFGCSVRGFDQSGNVQTTLFQINAGDQTCNINNERILFVENMGMAPVTVFGEDLTSQCDEFSSNRPTSIKYKLKYSILDQFTGDLFPENRLEVSVTCCHTGYVFDKKENKCIFDRSRAIFIAATQNNRYVYIKAGFFAQHMPESNQLICGILPPSYHSCTIQSETTTIQGCLFKFDHPYEQCSDNRTGFMCGKCLPSEGLALNLSDCLQCQASDVILFILFCIFVIVASILIMTFDIGLSNSLRGFLFFAQVVNIVYQCDSGEGTTLDYHLARQFGRSLYLPICLSNTMDALSVVLLGLVVPLMMLLMVLLFIFLARHIRYLSQHQSVNGIWLIIFLMYVYTARTSFDLLRCVPTYDIDDNSMGQRYYYDGSIECYRGKHLYYALVSFLLLCTIIIPGPFIVVLISYRHFKRTGPFKDVATKGLKQKYHWWSAYDLLRRLAFMLIILFDGYFTAYQQFLLTIISIVCLIITARFHPYQNYWDNLVETLILVDLMLITAYYLPDSSRFVVAKDTFGIILLYLPFVYCILYISVLVTKKLWFKFCSKVQMNNKDTEATTFNKLTSHRNDKKFFNQVHDNYDEFRDELLVIDSITST